MSTPSATEQLFDTKAVGDGMIVVTHRLTGDTKVFGGATGIPLEHADYWKRSYVLPILGSFHSGCFPNNGAQIEIKPISLEDLKQIRLISNIQDSTFEQVISTVYGKEIPYSKQPIKLSQGQSIVVARYIGPYLSDGATGLPADARLSFFVVRVMVEYQNRIAENI